MKRKLIHPRAEERTPTTSSTSPRGTAKVRVTWPTSILGAESRAEIEEGIVV